MDFDILHLNGTNPLENLVLEEWLCRQRRGNRALFLLYRNAPSVVIGRNQNPWQEADVDWLRQNGYPLIRRASGGGAVWHDGGNLNLSFLIPRSTYEPERFLAILPEALQTFGISAEICERRSIWVDGFKIAGSAFMLTGKTALIHACVLVNADLPRLRRSLKAPERNITTRALSSVPASVLNLQSRNPELSVAGLETALIGTLKQQFQVIDEHWELPPKNDAFEQLYQERESWDWIFGRTPEFCEHGGESRITVRRALITEVDPPDNERIGKRYGEG